MVELNRIIEKIEHKTFISFRRDIISNNCSIEEIDKYIENAIQEVADSLLDNCLEYDITGNDWLEKADTIATGLKVIINTETIKKNILDMNKSEECFDMYEVIIYGIETKSILVDNYFQALSIASKEKQEGNMVEIVELA